MKSERRDKEDSLNHWIFLISSLTSSMLVAALVWMEFPTHIANRIKERAEGKCESCGKHVGKEKLIAGHLKHKRDDHDIRNGRAHCMLCEARYHVSHLGSDSSKIGLRRSENASESWHWWLQLSKEDKSILEKEYPDKIARLKERFEKN